MIFRRILLPAAAFLLSMAALFYVLGIVTEGLPPSPPERGAPR